MSFFGKFFGGDEKEGENGHSNNQDVQQGWHNLIHLDQLGQIMERSQTKPQLIFKHSTRCGISRMVLNQFKKEYDLTEEDADFYYLDLLKHRDISSAIAEQYGVRHESPQLLVIKNGKVAAHGSHSGINHMDLKSFV